MAKMTNALHIGIIVDDFDKAVKGWESLGFGSFTVFENDEETDRMANGRPLNREFSPRVGFSTSPGLTIELIEAGVEGAYREWLDKNGPGIHHVSITADDYEGFVEECRTMTEGRPFFIEGFNPGHGEPDTRFSYIDMCPEIGAVLEIGEFHENPA